MAWTVRSLLAAAILLGIVVSSTVVRADTGTESKPVVPRATYRSPNFEVHTDLPKDEAKVLMDKLETMIGLISKYWGRPCSGTIECYVVRDLSKFNKEGMEARGIAKIAEGAGVTMTTTATLGNRFRAKAVVYAVADKGVAQHEAVHAYCAQTWGSTGPTWYAEGMAEMGQYWKAGDLSVNADPVVIKYIRQSKPKGLLEIVDTTDITGDSWQNYAWRWALCHLLANNTNYMRKFHPLGVGLLTRQKVSFEDVYGDVAREISFEYLFFLEHLGTGYRVDLCSWDWNTRFKPLKSSSIVSKRVEAGRGWQGSGLSVEKGQEFEFAATGKWKTGEGDLVDADGTADGAGRLVGILFDDYKLQSEEFELGKYGTFTAPADGKLYLRCRDDWSSVDDNKGRVSVRLKVHGKGDPLPEPK